MTVPATVLAPKRPLITVSLHIYSDQVEQLKDLGEASGRNTSDIARELLDRALTALKAA